MHRLGRFGRFFLPRGPPPSGEKPPCYPGRPKPRYVLPLSLYFSTLQLLINYVVVHEQVVGGIVVPLSKRVVACLGVDDLVIVDTPDALLVTTRARSQDLKKLVNKCRETGWKQVL